DFSVQVLVERLETTLGQTALQRHLTALEADLVKTARTGLLAFVATATGLAQTGTDATADPALRVLGAGCGLQRIESNGVFHCYSLGFRHGDQIGHLADHATHFRRILQHAAAVHAAQSEATHGSAVRFT